MSIFSKLFRRKKSVPVQESQTDKRAETLEYLQRFMNTRAGCEMYIEPPTNVTQTTIILVATSGEWTRRKVPDAQAGWKLAKELGIACYDVQLVGYPQRMRQWNAQKRKNMNS